MFTLSERRAITQILDGIPFMAAQDWMFRNLISDGSLFGWGHLYEQHLVTTWGGTTDAIRALLACGIAPSDPTITKAVGCIVSQQREDGSFIKRGASWPSVEASAWSLVVLKQLQYHMDPKVVQNAVRFLESCIRQQGGLATSPSTQDEVRIYPSIITLWALHGLSQREGEIAAFLKRSVDKQTGGWGPRPGLPGNVALTAHVVYILLVTGYLDPEAEMCKRAVDFILSKANAQGNWDNFTETWYTINQVTPSRCDHYTTPWALLALLEAKVSVFDPHIVRAVSFLISNQLADGAWILSDSEPNEYTWCVANCVVALSRVRHFLTGPIVQAALASGGLHELQNISIRTHPLMYLRNQFTRENLNTILILAVFIILLHDPINQVIGKIQGFLQVQQGSIISNLVSSFIWVLIAALFTLVASRFRKK